MTKNDLIYVISVICVAILFLLIGLSNAPTKTEYIEIPKTVTAYCPYEDEYGNATAKPYNGEYIAVEGITVAVDPEIIPYGSVVIIDGHSYIAHDCGGAVKGKVIDIYFDSVEKMNAWGKQTKEVYVKK